MRDVFRDVHRTSPMLGSDGQPKAHDFSCAYEIAISPGDSRSSEQWGRAVWEGAPPLLRWFMLAGWRLVLGLRLGPRPSPDHILGWQIASRGVDDTVCELRSGFLTAYNVFRTTDGRFVWSTFVTYDRSVARLIWLPVSLLHRFIVRVAIRLAATHPLPS